jgi:hypothetical protein
MKLTTGVKEGELKVIAAYYDLATGKGHAGLVEPVFASSTVVGAPRPLSQVLITRFWWLCQDIRGSYRR